MTLRFTALLGLALLPVGASLAAPPSKPMSKPAATPFVSASALLKSAPAASAYPNAAACTLRDESVVRLNADGSNVTHVHATIKIFNQRGRGYAEVSIPYNASTDAVTGLQARTVRPDGKVLTVKAADIRDSSPFSDFAMYDDSHVKNFSMPGIEDGAIIDYAYTITTRRAVMPGQFDMPWTFQGDSEPVKMSRLTIDAPVSLAVNVRPRNADKMKTTTHLSLDGKRKTTVWEMTNIADWTPEPMMPPMQTVAPILEISTVPSWQTIAQWYSKLEKTQTTVTPEIKTIVKTVTAGKTSDTEKAKALFYWVEGKTRYVAIELGQSAFQPHAAGEVCANRYGDCKDMATLLVTMLHEAGIKTAWPVLLSSGNKLPLRDRLASPGAFNHAIVRADIDGKPYWFDSTAELCAFGDIPGSDRGCDAFVIKDGIGAFETIPVGDPANNQTVITNRVKLAADGSADCTMETKTDGDAALGMRFQFRAIKPDQLQEGFRAMARRFSPNATLEKFTLSPIEDRDRPMGFDCAYHAPLWATKVGKMLLIPGSDADASLYTRPTRVFPMYSSSTGKTVYQTFVTLPDGYVLEETPKDIHLQTPFGDYDQTYKLDGQTLAITQSSASLPALVPAADYVKLKTQFDALAPLFKQPVLVKPAR